MSCSLKKGTFKEQRSVFSKFLTRTFRKIFDKASLKNESSIFVEEIPRAGFLMRLKCWSSPAAPANCCPTWC